MSSIHNLDGIHKRIEIHATNLLSVETKGSQTTNDNPILTHTFSPISLGDPSLIRTKNGN